MPPPSVIVPLPAFSPPAAIVTLTASTRLILPLPVVVAVTVAALIRTKFVVEPMPPKPAPSTTSAAEMSVPILSFVVIAPALVIVT